MCLAIPAKIVEFPESDKAVAVAEVGGVRRRVNVDLLRDTELAVGDWVLLHVGFAMSRIYQLLAELAVLMFEERSTRSRRAFRKFLLAL